MKKSHFNPLAVFAAAPRLAQIKLGQAQSSGLYALVILVFQFAGALFSAEVTLQPGPLTSKDIWTTSVYSYAPGGSTPGGGLNNEVLRVGGWSDSYYSLLQFDVSSLPANATNAKLRLYAIPDTANNTALYLYRITALWDWRTMGTGRDRERLWWADRPSAVQWIPGSLPAPTRSAWYEIDITSLYNSWKDGSLPNYGVQLRPVSTSSNNFATFYSSEFTVNPDLRPQLVVTSTDTGPLVQISGTVSDDVSQPIQGASIRLKRRDAIFWQGVSGAGGTFSTPSISASDYTLTVSKEGFVTGVSSLVGTSGGNVTANVTLRPLPLGPGVTATNQTPPSTAVRPPAPANPADPNAPKLMRYDGAGHFTTSLTGLDPGRMTVVLSHGWKSSPNEWSLALALLIQQHHALGANTPNILAWDWNVQANIPTPQPDRAVEQGIELGKALRTALGTSYSQHMHFIGHSLGCIVNCNACDYVHGGFARSSNNPANPWNPLVTKPHVTLLDEAELATVFGQNVTTAAAIGWKVAQLKGALIAGGAAAAADWKNTIPKQAKWVDNYISLVGLQRDAAVNVCLIAPTVAFDWISPINSLTFAHSYAHLFYRNTVWPSGPAPAVGFGQSFEGGSAFPPSGSGLSAGSTWYEYLGTPDPLDLLRDYNPSAFECNLTILSAVMVQPAAGLETIGNYVGETILDTYETTIEWAGDIGGTVIYKSGQVITQTKEKMGNWWDAALDAASDTLNSIDPEMLLAGPVTAPVMSMTLESQATPPEMLKQAERNGVAVAPGQPAYAWMSVDVPANAGLMAFDFTVTGDPQEDSVACAVNGQNIFTLLAKFAPDGSPVSTDMMDISAYAGQPIELFFGLVGGTSTNCSVAVDGIRFITIPQPKIDIVEAGANFAIKWPAAATGWVLESSDTLAPGTWQTVNMAAGVTVAAGVATLEVAKTGDRRFYRLRRVQ